MTQQLFQERAYDLFEGEFVGRGAGHDLDPSSALLLDELREPGPVEPMPGRFLVGVCLDRFVSENRRRGSANPAPATSMIRVAIGAAPVLATVPHLWLAPHITRKAAKTGRLRVA